MTNDQFVRLDAFLADDLSVINTARVSFGKRKEELDEADKGLIRFLMREHHGTPFEHNFFRFHVRAPIFVAREWFRHRSGWSYNEFSGRYSVMPNSAWIPDTDEVRTQVGKPGAYSFETVEPELADRVRDMIDNTNRHAYRVYNTMLDLGIAKEVARTVLPVGTMTEFYATCNARSLMHFCALRNHSSAQQEIRWYAEQLERNFAQAMPETYAAFVEFGRTAP